MSLIGTGRRVLGRLVPFARQRGALSVAASCVDWAVRRAVGRPRAGRPSRTTFEFDGRRVPYVHHAYNNTWLNERAVEVALAKEVLASCRPERVLEIGNVLGHYGSSGHTVVDKYEQGAGVLNLDVSELGLDRQYDLVVSVSTMEHVGFDEDVQDPEKPGRSLDRLRGVLAPGGRLWVSLPVGYNPELDRRLRAGVYGFTTVRALRRERRRNIWREVPTEQVWGAEYDRLLYTAHGLVIAEYHDAP